MGERQVRRRGRSMTLTGLVSAGLLVAAAAAPALAADGPAPSGTSTPGAQDAALPVSAVPDDLPSGVPAAALAVPATLPTAAGWTLPEPFPRTSGTGRHSGGVFAWSDFLFDDHGAGGPVPVPGTTPTMLAPAFGTATYPDGPAAANGADVFRTALGVTPDATSFRVDWTTLADPDVPVAVLGLGAADGPARAFPGGAGVSAAGLERAVVLSSRGAWLHDLAAGTVTDLVAAGAVVTVDEELGAFVLTAPRSALDLPDGVRLWLVAGLADASGEGLAPAEGVLPGASRVYNAAFRDYADEDVVGVDAGGAEYQNFWFERAQALALTAGDVTAFSVDVDVAGLRAGRSDPEPQPTGYSNRWYVSSLDPPGDGVDSDAEDLEPAYLGRVQPYAVDVPSGYDPATPASLTWMLHSLGVQHNQYGALDPQQRADTCEARGSICATTLGFGPAGWYFDEAELDFWEVWRDLADTYSLDPERTVLTGYSMGGYGTYSLGAAYPDLFAQAQMLAAPPLCGIRTSEDTVVSPAGPGPCTTAGSTTPLLPALRHVPFVVGHGAVDELVPVTSVLEHVAAADAAGLRYDFHLYPAAGHLAWAVSDGFTNESAALRLDERTVDPGTVDYPFYPQRVREDLGFGPDGAYWLFGVAGRDAVDGQPSRATAVSAARPDPVVTLVDTAGALPPTVPYPGPGTFQRQQWQTTPAPGPPAPRVDLTLERVGTATVDVARAGLVPGDAGSVPVVTDGPVRVTVAGLAPGTELLRDGQAVATAGPGGLAAADLSGDAVLSWALVEPQPVVPEAPWAVLLPMLALAAGGALLTRRSRTA